MKELDGLPAALGAGPNQRADVYPMLEQAEARIARLESRVTKLATQYKALDASLGDLRKSVEYLRGVVDALKTRLTVLDAVLRDVEARRP